MKVVADDKIPFLKGVLERENITVEYHPGGKITPAVVAGADALVTRTRTKCDAALLEHSPLRFIATATIGFDHIDTPWVEKHGISWTNAPGCNSASVAQYMTSVLLHWAVNRRIALAGKTLGVVGVGNVGKKVAAVGRALGMRVLLNDPPRARLEGVSGFCTLDDIVREADVVTFHVPLERHGADPTFHLADAALIARLRPDQFLVNASRGEVVDNTALRMALQARALSGAVLDVWENEPAIDLELLNLLEYATPHIAGYSTDGKANGTAMSVNALAKFFGLGEPLQSWYPGNVPLPETTRIVCPENGSIEEKLLAVTAVSYDIQRDTRTLKNSPETFEKQRGNYPLRREFPVFSVAGGAAEVREILGKLGFNLVD